LKLGPPIPIVLGSGGSGSRLTGRLDLGRTEVHGSLDAEVTSDYGLARTLLEIDPGTGWVPLGAAAQRLHLSAGGGLSWPVRLRVGSCPEGSARRRFQVVITATGADGQAQTSVVPLAVEVIPEPWLRCWWPILALALGAVLLGIVVYGFWSPSRFPGRLGVVLSPEADMGEGFLYPIRGQRGTGSGFFRDARVYVCQDFRLAGRPRNAVVRLRAEAQQVRIAAVPGAAVWRQGADGGWEPLPPGESTARFGTIYKNDLGSLFFELRNA
jgi:hypothetical protein